MKNLMLRNGVYYFVQVRNGKQVWKSLRTKDLEEAKRKLLGHVKPETIEADSVGEFASLWIEHFVKLNRNPANVLTAQRRLKKYILPVVGETPLNGVSASSIRALRVFCESLGASPLSVRHILSDFRNLLNCAHEDGRINSVPSFKRLMPKIPEKSPKALNREQVEELLAVAKPEYRVALELALYTGCRWGELRRLKWSDVRELPFPHLRLVAGKNGKQRTIPLLPEAESVLLEIRTRWGKDKVKYTKHDRGDHVLPIRPHGPGSFVQYLKPQLSFPFHFHMLRHTFCTWMLETGYNKEMLRLWLGHSTIRLIEETYGHLTDDLMVSGLSEIQNPFANGANGSSVKAGTANG